VKRVRSGRGIPEATRFWSYVEFTDTCWLWLAGKDREGYGVWTSPNSKSNRAHRWAWEWLHRRSIPDGLVIDHLCNNPSCVNPWHLKATTQRENVLRSAGVAAVNARKTHCPHGHEYTDENTYHQPGGRRTCRTCRAIQYQLRRIAWGLCPTSDIHLTTTSNQRKADQ